MERMGGMRQNLGNRSGGRRSMIRASLTYNLGSSALDAAPYALNGISVDKPSWTRQTFGGNLGGNLPFLKFGESRRSFMMISYQGTRSRNAYSSFSVVPDAAERNGDFSQEKNILYDPSSNLPFTNNQIPSSRIDTAAAGLLQFYPAPNMTSNIQNYALISAIPTRQDSLNMRWMQPISATDRLSFNMSLMWNNRTSLQALGFKDTSQGRGRNIGLGWNHTLNPATNLNLSFRYNLNKNITNPYFANGPDIAGELGITGTSQEPINFGPPNLNFTNFADLSDATYASRRTNTFNTGVNLSWVKGTHTFTYGFSWNHQRMNSLAEQNARGTFTFTGTSTSGLDANGLPLPQTGLDLADFLLGLPQQTTVRYNGADTYLRSNTYGAYAQDTWRFKSNLTLTLGLRYDYFSPFTEKYGRMANLDLAPGFSGAAVVTPGASGPYSGVFPDGLIDPDRNNFSPRLGIAWKPKSNVVLRGGYSIFYDGSVFGRIPSQLASQPPFATSGIYVNGVDASLTLKNGFNGPAEQQQESILNTVAVDRSYAIPYAQTWNADVQYSFPREFVLNVGYLGTKGTRLVIQRLPNRVVAGQGTSAVRLIPDAVGFTYDSTEGNSIYHALQVRLMRRMRRGISMTTHYTFSKSIDDASTIGGGGSTIVQNDQDISAERGLSSFDRRHALTSSLYLNSPFGPMGTVMRQDNLVTKLIRGWIISSSLTLQSGAPFTARALGNASNAGGSGSIGNARADATGLPIEGGLYFNPLAFAVPAADTYGNAGRNTITGPGMISLNVGLARSFRIGDDFRRQIMFRLDSQNVTNTVNISGIGTVVNSSNYGLATSAAGMRQVTLSVRVGF